MTYTDNDCDLDVELEGWLFLKVPNRNHGLENDSRIADFQLRVVGVNGPAYNLPMNWCVACS